MKYPRILAAIRSAKWAVRPETLHAIRDVLSARLAGRLNAPLHPLHPLTPAALEDDDVDAPVGQPPFEHIAPGIARVCLHGIIGKNLSALEMMCGGCDLAVVEDNLTAALADSAVTTVILDIDSPGGTVSGVAEFAARIPALEAAAGKSVIAYASGQCCSAAYWVACGCTAIACSASSDVGSIGVYSALVDESENWAEEGYKLVLIKAGEFKAAGIPGSKITPEQIALWQKEVDYIYTQFTSYVRAARPGVETATLQGQTFYGPLALEARLVDEVCTLEELCTDCA
jgi:signal peptide peptidase SppA